MVERSYKQGRIGDSIQKELARMIRSELSDPRLGFITISEVVVTLDLSIARIYVTVLEESKQAENIIILQGAAKFLRNGLAKKLKLRHTPRLEFFYDHGLDNGIKMTALIEQVVSGDKHSAH